MAAPSGGEWNGVARQICGLLQKQKILRVRRWRWTLCELLLPVLFVSLLAVLRSLTSTELRDVPAQTLMNSEVDLLSSSVLLPTLYYANPHCVWREDDGTERFSSLAVTPRSWGSAFVDFLRDQPNPLFSDLAARFRIMDSEDDIIKLFNSSTDTWDPADDPETNYERGGKWEGAREVESRGFKEASEQKETRVQTQNVELIENWDKGAAAEDTGKKRETLKVAERDLSDKGAGAPPRQLGSADAFRHRRLCGALIFDLAEEPTIPSEASENTSSFPSSESSFVSPAAVSVLSASSPEAATSAASPAVSPPSAPHFSSHVLSHQLPRLAALRLRLPSLVGQGGVSTRLFYSQGGGGFRGSPSGFSLGTLGANGGLGAALWYVRGGFMSWMVLAYSFLIEKTRQETLFLLDRLQHRARGRLDLNESPENQGEKLSEGKDFTYDDGEMNADIPSVSPRRYARRRPVGKGVDGRVDTVKNERTVTPSNTDVKDSAQPVTLRRSEGQKNEKENIKGSAVKAKELRETVTTDKEPVSSGDNRKIDVPTESIGTPTTADTGHKEVFSSMSPVQKARGDEGRRRRLSSEMAFSASTVRSGGRSILGGSDTAQVLRTDNPLSSAFTSRSLSAFSSSPPGSSVSFSRPDHTPSTVASSPFVSESLASSLSASPSAAGSSPWLLQGGPLASLPVLPLSSRALRVDVFLLVVGPLLILVLLLCFAVSVVSLQREVVGDREEGRRAVMTAMGMHPLAYYIAWFADFAAMQGVISFFLVWVLSAYLVLPCTPALLLFFLLLLASMAIALWGLALSTLFGKARPAAAVALLVHVLAYFAVYTIDQEDDRTRRVAWSLLPQCAFVLGLRIVVALELAAGSPDPVPPSLGTFHSSGDVASTKTSNSEGVMDAMRRVWGTPVESEALLCLADMCQMLLLDMLIYAVALFILDRWILRGSKVFGSSSGRWRFLSFLSPRFPHSSIFPISGLLRFCISAFCFLLFLPGRVARWLIRVCRRGFRALAGSLASSRRPDATAREMQVSVHPTSLSLGYQSSFSGLSVRGGTLVSGADGLRDASLSFQSVAELQNQEIRFPGDLEAGESHKSVTEELMAGPYKNSSTDASWEGEDEMRDGLHHVGETAGRINLEREDAERKEEDFTSLSKETGKHMRRRDLQEAAVGSRKADSATHLCSPLGACQRMCEERGDSFQPSFPEHGDTDKLTTHQMRLIASKRCVTLKHVYKWYSPRGLASAVPMHTSPSYNSFEFRLPTGAKSPSPRDQQPSATPDKFPNIRDQPRSRSAQGSQDVFSCEKDDTFSALKTGILGTTEVLSGQTDADDNEEQERAERFYRGEESTSGQPAVADVSLRLYEGEIFVLLGPNGAGKSSLMNVISGMDEATSGFVEAFGCKLPEDKRQLQQQLGICPQGSILWPELTVYEHCKLFSSFKNNRAEAVSSAYPSSGHVEVTSLAASSDGSTGSCSSSFNNTTSAETSSAMSDFSRNPSPAYCVSHLASTSCSTVCPPPHQSSSSSSSMNIDEAIDAFLSSLSLTEVAHRLVRELSGGMRRRVAVALCLLFYPKLCILDEPSSGLDPGHRESLFVLLRLMRPHCCMLVSTQHTDDAEAVADRIGIMHEGRLLCVGSPFDLRRRFGGGYRLRVLLRVDGSSISRTSARRDAVEPLRGRQRSQATIIELDVSRSGHREFAAGPANHRISRIISLLEQSLQDSRQPPEGFVGPLLQQAPGTRGDSLPVVSNEGGGNAVASKHVNEDLDMCDTAVGGCHGKNACSMRQSKQKETLFSPLVDDDSQGSRCGMGRKNAGRDEVGKVSNLRLTPGTVEPPSVKRLSSEQAACSHPESRHSARPGSGFVEYDAARKLGRLCCAEDTEKRKREKTAPLQGSGRERRPGPTTLSQKLTHRRRPLSSEAKERQGRHVYVERISIAPAVGDACQEPQEDDERGSDSDTVQVGDAEGSARISVPFIRKTDDNGSKSYGRNGGKPRSPRTARGTRRTEESSSFLEVTLRIPLDSGMRLGPALRDLENHKEALEIVSYGVFAPTMHDVFTRVCAKRSSAADHQEVSFCPSALGSSTPSRTSGAQIQAEATKACTSNKCHQSQHGREASHPFSSPPSPPSPCFWRRGLSSDPTCNRRSRLVERKEEKAENERLDASPRQHSFFKVSRARSANSGRKSSREEEQQQHREVQLVPLDEPRLVARRTDRDPARGQSVYRRRKEDNEKDDSTPAVQDPTQAENEGTQDGEGRRWMRAMLEEPLVCSVRVPTGHSTRGSEQAQQQSSQPNQDRNESLSRACSVEENEEDKENELKRRRRRVFFSLFYKRFRFLQRYPRAACTQLCAGPLIVLSVLLLVTFFSSYSSLYDLPALVLEPEFAFPDFSRSSLSSSFSPTDSDRSIRCFFHNSSDCKGAPRMPSSKSGPASFSVPFTASSPALEKAVQFLFSGEEGLALPSVPRFPPPGFDFRPVPWNDQSADRRDRSDDQREAEAKTRPIPLSHLPVASFSPTPSNRTTLVTSFHPQVNTASSSFVSSPVDSAVSPSPSTASSPQPRSITEDSPPPFFPFFSRTFVITAALRRFSLSLLDSFQRSPGNVSGGPPVMLGAYLFYRDGDQAFANTVDGLRNPAFEARILRRYKVDQADSEPERSISGISSRPLLATGRGDTERVSASERPCTQSSEPCNLHHVQGAISVETTETRKRPSSTLVAGKASHGSMPSVNDDTTVNGSALGSLHKRMLLQEEEEMRRLNDGKVSSESFLPTAESEQHSDASVLSPPLRRQTSKKEGKTDKTSLQTEDGRISRAGENCSHGVAPSTGVPRSSVGSSQAKTVGSDSHPSDSKEIDGQLQIPVEARKGSGAEAGDGKSVRQLPYGRELEDDISLSENLRAEGRKEREQLETPLADGNAFQDQQRYFGQGIPELAGLLRSTSLSPALAYAARSLVGGGEGSDMSSLSSLLRRVALSSPENSIAASFFSNSTSASPSDNRLDSSSSHFSSLTPSSFPIMVPPGFLGDLLSPQGAVNLTSSVPGPRLSESPSLSTPASPSSPLPSTRSFLESVLHYVSHPSRAVFPSALSPRSPFRHHSSAAVLLGGDIPLHLFAVQNRPAPGGITAGVLFSTAAVHSLPVFVSLLLRALLSQEQRRLVFAATNFLESSQTDPVSSSSAPDPQAKQGIAFEEAGVPMLREDFPVNVGPQSLSSSWSERNYDDNPRQLGKGERFSPSQQSPRRVDEVRSYLDRNNSTPQIDLGAPRLTDFGRDHPTETQHLITPDSKLLFAQGTTRMLSAGARHMNRALTFPSENQFDGNGEWGRPPSDAAGSPDLRARAAAAVVTAQEEYLRNVTVDAERQPARDSGMEEADGAGISPGTKEQQRNKERIHTGTVEDFLSEKLGDVPFVNHPLPAAEIIKNSRFMQNVDALCASLTSLFAFSLLPGGIIAFLSAEASSHLKFLQLASGVSPALYWSASFSFDFLSVLFSVICILFLFLLFQIRLVVSSVIFPAFLVLVVSYAFAAVTHTSFLSLVFHSTSSSFSPFSSSSSSYAQLIVVAVNALLCPSLALFTYALLLLSFDPRLDFLRTLSHSVSLILRLFFPSFCISHALLIFPFCDEQLHGDDSFDIHALRLSAPLQDPLPTPSPSSTLHLSSPLYAHLKATGGQDASPSSAHNTTSSSSPAGLASALLSGVSFVPSAPWRSQHGQNLHSSFGSSVSSSGKSPISTVSFSVGSQEMKPDGTIEMCASPWDRHAAGLDILFLVLDAILYAVLTMSGEAFFLWRTYTPGCRGSGCSRPSGLVRSTWIRRVCPIDLVRFFRTVIRRVSRSGWRWKLFWRRHVLAPLASSEVPQPRFQQFGEGEILHGDERLYGVAGADSGTSASPGREQVVRAFRDSSHGTHHQASWSDGEEVAWDSMGSELAGQAAVHGQNHPCLSGRCRRPTGEHTSVTSETQRVVNMNQFDGTTQCIVSRQVGKTYFLRSAGSLLLGRLSSSCCRKRNSQTTSGHPTRSSVAEESNRTAPQLFLCYPRELGERRNTGFREDSVVTFRDEPLPHSSLFSSSKVDALAEFTFAAREGEVVALVGQNGAGKSTALRLLCGREPPDQGLLQVREGYRGVEERDRRVEATDMVAEVPCQRPIRRGEQGEGEVADLVGPASNSSSCVAMVPIGGDEVGHVSVRDEKADGESNVTIGDLGICPQEETFWDFLSPLEHLQLFASIRAYSYAKKGSNRALSVSLACEINDTLEAVQLSPHAAKRASHLSGGMRRKLNLAMAVVCRPPVLLLDEPSCGLDPLARLAIAKVIKRLSSSSRSPSFPSLLSLNSGRASRLTPREETAKEEYGFEEGDVGQKTTNPCEALHVERKGQTAWEREQENEKGYSSIPLRIDQENRPGPTRRSTTQATMTTEEANPWSASCIVISSHAMEEVEALASRVLVLENGRLLCIGTPQQITDWFSPGLLLTVHLPVPNLATFLEPVSLFSSASSSEGQAPLSGLSLPLSTPAVLNCPTWARCPSPSTDRISPRVRPEDAVTFTSASPVYPSFSMSTSSAPGGRLKACVASGEIRNFSSPAAPADEPGKRARVSPGICEMLRRLPRGGWMPASLLLHICELFDVTRSASSAFHPPSRRHAALSAHSPFHTLVKRRLPIAVDVFLEWWMLEDMAERLLGFLQSQCKSSFSVSESGATGPLRHFVILGRKKQSQLYCREPTTAGEEKATSRRGDNCRRRSGVCHQGKAEEKMTRTKEKVDQGEGAVESIAGCVTGVRGSGGGNWLSARALHHYGGESPSDFHVSSGCRKLPRVVAHKQVEISVMYGILYPVCPESHSAPTGFSTFRHRAGFEDLVFFRFWRPITFC
ncbi:atp-binding cassette sub-family a member [Cystoisospora suis]|uniref:Atp-binding cassette sub-family a member n=1 Tax=Cystoisospora suis TaxID=483139 RepID=A0A2C6L5V2_9APIC|nr:atp-binding cassette sub-family a member [Cystoisospora suis]